VGIWQGKGEMAELLDAVRTPDLTPVAPEVERAEGEPRPVFTWQADAAATHPCRFFRSSIPSTGGAPRLIVDLHPEGGDRCVGAWDTETGALLHMLPCECTSLVTYQRPSDGRARIAAGTIHGRVLVLDGDDFCLLSTSTRDGEGGAILRLVAYHEPKNGGTFLGSWQRKRAIVSQTSHAPCGGTRNEVVILWPVKRESTTVTHPLSVRKHS
jgi:hypothetical protein